MSKMKHTLCYMAALVGFAACTQDELTGDTGKGQYPLTLTATVSGGADTRATVEGTWEEGNAITLAIGKNKYTYQYGTDNAWTSSTPYFWKEGDDAISVSAYSFGGKATGDYAVQADQNAGDGYQSSDLLYAPAVEVTHGEDAELTFYHQTAKVVVNIKKEGIMAENREHKVTIQGALSGTFAAPTGTETFGSWTADASEGSSITPQTITHTNEYAASYQALLIPQDIGGKKFIAVTIDGVTCYYTPPARTSLEGGKCYTYNVKVDTSGEVTVNSIEPGNWGDGGSYDLSTQ